MDASLSHWTRRYAWAPATVLAATLVIYFGPIILRQEGMAFVFLAAVVISTLMGGVVPGLLATVFSLLAANWLLISFSQEGIQASNVIAEAIFLVICLIVISTVGVRRRVLQALQISESRFRTAQELSLDAFTVLRAVRDNTGTIVDFTWTYANPAAERILKRKDLEGKRLLEQLPGNRDNDALFKRYAAITESGGSHDMELYYNADGINGWFRNMALKLDDGVAVSFSDITRRRRTEEDLQELNRTLEQRVQERTAALKQSQEDLRQSERLAAIGEMITGISHESRNALQRSLACVQMLDRRLKDQPEQHRLLSEIRAAHDELLRVYEGVVAYARPYDLMPMPTNIAEVWRTAWAKLAPRNDGAALIEDVDDASCLCEADPVLLEQVFRNIFDNALSACPAPIKVWVSLAPAVLGETPSVRIRIRDNGPGVPSDLRSRIFEPFVTTKTKGTGLGLAVVKRAIEAHGGTVQLTEGESQCFEIVLEIPRRQPAGNKP